MTDTARSLESLLERLHAGDESAAEQLFRDYEPYLRLFVRRQLSASMRAKFDSQDVVQSVWADLWHGFQQAGWKFSDSDHLRAFLVRITKNRLIDRLRYVRRRGEQPIADEETPMCDAPTPSHNAEAGELWERLLAICPPKHHELLRMKRDGATLDQLAKKTGLHASSIRRILYDLARRFALVDEPRTK